MASLGPGRGEYHRSAAAGTAICTAHRAYAWSVICPKCQGRLQTVERQGLRIEQCERCRGIFLDHGELEQMLSAEQHYYAAPQYRGGHADSPRPYQGHADSPRPYRGHSPGYADSPRPYRGHSGGYADSPRPYGHRSHKRSFLGDLFG